VLLVPLSFLSFGHGQVLCGYAWSDITRYLGKYFSKDYGGLDGYNPAWSNLRRFGSSQLGFYKYPDWAYNELMTMADDGVPVGELYVRKTGSTVRLYGDDYDSLWADGRWRYLRSSEKHRLKLGVLAHYKVLVAEIRSPWKMVEADG